MEYPEGLERYKLFSRFLLEGQVGESVRLKYLNSPFVSNGFGVWKKSWSLMFVTGFSKTEEVRWPPSVESIRHAEDVGQVCLY